MASSGNLDENIIAFAADRNKAGDPYVSELLKGLVASFKDLEQKNRELEKRNTELISALQQANEKIAKTEQYPGSNPELSKMALKAAAEILESAEEAVGAVRLAAKAQATDRYRDATSRLMDLQRQMASLLEASRDENARCDQEANERALNILLGSKKSILSMAEDLDAASSESKISHVTSRLVSPEDTAISYQRSAISDQLLAISNRLPGSGQQAAGSRQQASRVRQEAPGFRSQNLEPTTQNLGFKPALGAQDTALKTQDIAFKAQDSTKSLAQTVELIASPFQSFGDLCAFQQAVQKLPGVIEVKAQSFVKGTLRLRIKRRSTIPLSTQLGELRDFPFELALATENSIEINLLW